MQRGWPSWKYGRQLWEPKFEMATVGKVDYCILNGLAYISALDMVSGVPLGKEFISDVRFILHRPIMAYR